MQLEWQAAVFDFGTSLMMEVAILRPGKKRLRYLARASLRQGRAAAEVQLRLFLLRRIRRKVKRYGRLSGSI